MGLMVYLFDEVLGVPAPDRHQRRQSAGSLDLVVDNLTVDEVIASRVGAEWAKVADASGRLHATNRTELATGLYRFGGALPATLPEAVAAAQEAFRTGTILFFWNNEQVVDPAAYLNLRQENEAVFLRLFPMKGG
jgi:hypothetical protein